MVDVTRFKAIGDTSGVSSSITSWIKDNKLLASSLVAVTAIAVKFKQQIDYGDLLEKTAQKTGLAVETLSQWKLGAELAGTSQEGLISGLQRLQKNMGAALRSPTSAAAQAFGDLAVTFVDAEGKARPVEDVARDISAAFGDLEDSSDKTRVSMDLMGRAGAELIPFLNQSEEALERVEEISNVLGVTWSTVAAKDAAAFNDSLTILKTVGDGVFSTASQFWIGTLADLAKAIEEVTLKTLGLSDTAGLTERQIVEQQIVQAREDLVAVVKEQALVEEELGNNASIAAQAAQTAARAAQDSHEQRIQNARQRLDAAKTVLASFGEEEAAIRKIREEERKAAAEEQRIGLAKVLAARNAERERIAAIKERQRAAEAAARAEVAAIQRIEAAVQTLGLTEEQVIKQQATENALALADAYAAGVISLDAMSARLAVVHAQEQAALESLSERQTASTTAVRATTQATVDYTSAIQSSINAGADFVSVMTEGLDESTAKGVKLGVTFVKAGTQLIATIASAATAGVAATAATATAAGVAGAVTTAAYAPAAAVASIATFGAAPAAGSGAIAAAIPAIIAALTGLIGAFAVGDAGMDSAMLAKARARGISQIFNLGTQPELLVDSRGTGAISDMLEQQRDERTRPSTPTAPSRPGDVFLDGELVGIILDARDNRRSERGLDHRDDRRF